MRQTTGPEIFNAVTVPLEGSNLIEASAGTGKTYSIAIMVLRLLLEQPILINQILMVTFTKAAVAELEERIRAFVRAAAKASNNEPINDPTIAALVQKAIDHGGSEKVQQQLRNAVLFLDETSVLTIHSFCQQTLTTFAFETDQLFGASTMQDTSAVLTDEVNQFWRKSITTMPVQLLELLVEIGLSRSAITGVVREHLSGKKYIAFEPDKLYDIRLHDYEKMLQDISELRDKEANLRSCLHEHIDNNRAAIVEKLNSNSYARKALLPLIEDSEAFVNELQNKQGIGYVQKLFGDDLLPQITSCSNALNARNEELHKLLEQINCFAISTITAGLQDYKQRNNLLTFDDMIVNLHKALTKKENTTLVSALQAKYKAVFIDEFQDTDRLQYEIFHTAFGSNTILFYIGDPKQSIYAWRKADIFTYFKAANGVQRHYSMNINYRSATEMIAAMNRFFLPREDFDTFYFPDSENTIRYVPVESPVSNSKGNLLLNNAAIVPLTITPTDKKEELLDAVAEQAAQLFAEGYTIYKNGKGRPISPADVGILVRTNAEAQSIKSALAAKHIPAVTINDERVLRSEEASFMLYLLQAMHDITPANLNKALLSPFTGYAVKDILELNDEVTIDRFRNYKKAWNEAGIYAALMQFVSDYNVRVVLLGNNTETGERIITNLFQLMELVHQVQSRKRYSPMELIGWLQRGIEGMETEGDDYEQRMESDEDAVKIVTIHKSKGLEYNIVLAPFLDFVQERKNSDYTSFRHPGSGEYVSVPTRRMSEEQKEWARQQTEQENRRLLYVAITRAVYKCFIFHNRYYKQGTLARFISEMATADELVAFGEPLTGQPMYARKTTWTPPVMPAGVDFQLLHNNWNRISYTALAAKGEHLPRPSGGIGKDSYDQFIFRQLTRGAKTGNLLHFLFENVDFANPAQWIYHVGQAIKRYVPALEKEYTPMLLQLLAHVTQAHIAMPHDAFVLASVGKQKRLNELEFDFGVPAFNPISLLRLQTPETGTIAVRQFEETEGVMNGKMDLFFEYNGRYYILDWKSNYLGDEPKHYAPALLPQAMSDNNYHLQYLIYTVAAVKFLQSRLPAFDYEQHFGGIIYLFVRGVRKGSDNGVYVNRPSWQQIEQLDRLLTA